MASARSEKASPRKLASARTRGFVPISGALLGAAACGALLLAAWVAGDFVVATARAAVLSGLRGEAISEAAFVAPSTTHPALASSFALTARLLAPALGGVLAAVALTGVVQTGGLWSARAWLPDAERLSPFERMAAWFSGDRLADAVMTALRVLVLLAVSYAVLAPSVRGVLALPSSSLPRASTQLGALASTFAVRIVAAALLLGLADFLYRRVMHALRMRMTRQELLDELRQTEGDPLLRAERSRRARAHESRS